MNKKQKKVLVRILAAALCMAVFSLLPVTGWLRFMLFMIPYLIIGYDILKKAGKGILNRQVFEYQRADGYPSGLCKCRTGRQGGAV